jgi:hypothetical protein
MPTDALLENNGLTQFQAVTAAVKLGDLGAFNQVWECLVDHGYLS